MEKKKSSPKTKKSNTKNNTKQKLLIKTLLKLKRTHGSTMLSDFKEEFTPFKMLIATILSARSKDETTIPIARNLLKKYPTPKRLANANQEDVEIIIKKSGFYKNKAKMVIKASQQLIEHFQGKVPQTMEELITLSGVGRKVAGCVLVYAFDKPAIPVDIHVHRIANRMGFVKTSDPEKTEQELMVLLPKKYWPLVNEFFVFHGKSVCNPRTPKCSQCSVTNFCEYYKHQGPSL